MTVELYRDRAGDWRWRVMERGRVIAESGEGYERPGRMMLTLRRIARELPKVVAEPPTIE